MSDCICVSDALCVFCRYRMANRRLRQQLAAERAKVALAEKTLRKLFYAAEPVADAFTESLFAEVCAVLNQSSEALAEIRRDAARKERV